MSTYYYFYIGKKEDGVFKAFDLYNAKQKPLAILCRSRSFISDLPDEFYHEEDEKKIGENIKHIAKEYKLCSDNTPDTYDLRYLSLAELLKFTKDGGIRHGYVDAEIVNIYEVYGKKEGNVFSDYEFDIISPIVYANMDKEEQKKYVYYSWIDYDSREYIANLLADIAVAIVDANLDYMKAEDIYIFMES